MGVPEELKRVLRDKPPFSVPARWAANYANEANRDHRLAAVARTIRYDVQTRLFKRPMVTRLGSRSKIHVRPDETNSMHAVWRNPPNWPHMGVWQQRLRPGDLFLDIGANIGIYTILALDLGAEVIAVEPNARNAQRLRDNIALNGYAATVLEAAVSSEPGTVRITTHLDSYNHLVTEGGAEVAATTLDDLLGDRTAAGVKIDVEGAERLVLEGASRALAEHRIGVLQLEWVDMRSQMTLSEGHEGIATMLRGYGYELYRPRRSDALLERCADVVPSDPIDVFAVPRA